MGFTEVVLKNRKKFYFLAVLSIFFIFIGFLSTAFTYRIMALTSTPSFCGSCHEIAPAVESWRTSSHAFNNFGVKATCMDCHLPPPERTLNFFFLKSKHGLKDVWAHFFHGEYNREEMQEKVHASMDNATCLNCHGNLLYIQSKRGAMKAHRDALYSKPQRRCMECHAPLVHINKEVYSFKE